ncbi:patellin-3-like [Cornus florida]|uniref:patellin-3-like n=1 Tax=Cornus florida TaxID=4283 RepID=UPI00289FFC1A|nr:patellin-3-like [Cornus florida]
MSELETTTTAPEAPATEEVVTEKPTTTAAAAAEKDPPLPAPPVVEAEEPKPAEEEKIAESTSFKEETNVVGELPDSQKKALDELKHLIQEALNKHEFTAPPPSKEEEKPAEAAPPTEEEKPTAAATGEEPKSEEKTEEAPAEVASPPPPPAAEASETAEAVEETVQPAEEVSIFGIPLLADERSDVILLKFLRGRDFKVKDAFTMIKNTVRWRKEFGIESLLEEELGAGTELEKVAFMKGVDKEGHPICYNVYGEFQNKDLYQNTFADDEKRQKFLRWRIQLLEKSIRKLDFSPDGISTIVQVNDLKNIPGPFKREPRSVTNQALQLLQDNYPEFVAKQVFINVPWWYLAYNRVMSITQRTKSKFVFAGPSKSVETLFKYIGPEQVPVQFGGLSREGEQELTTDDSVTVETIKPTSEYTIEIPVSEKCVLVWEARVVGWDVSYGAQFEPSAEDGYTIIVQKTRKISPSDEPVICNSFKIGEPGKVVLKFDNQTSKKKHLLYRSKTKPSD